MRISINEHVDGDTRVKAGVGAAALDGVRDVAARGDRRLERVRRKLDHPRRVLVRDFVIFECKLFLDWLKGPIIAWTALFGFLVDLVRPGGRSFGVFYKVLALGERLDMWLSLYGASRRAGEDPEGLLGQSREGSPSMLGQLERVVHRIVVGQQEGELYPRGDVGTAGSAASAGPGRPAAPAERSSFETESGR